MAIESITKTLGSGSGIDVSALVKGLVDAQFATKTAALAKRQETLTAQISGVSALRSTITDFDAALSTLIAGGTLASKLTSSNDAAVKATAVAGGDLSALSAKVGVTQLADAQVTTTNTAVPRTGTWQTGTLTLRMGRDVVNTAGAVTGFTASGSGIAISITAADNTLDKIAAKINATPGVSATGVVASVVDDGTGARLVMRGPSGGDKAFEMAVSGASGGGNALANLAVSRTSTTTTSGTRARDAIVTVDGVRYTRATNTVAGVVPGVTLDLLAVTTTPATLSMAKPTQAISSAVTDFVSAYNEMLAGVKKQADPVTGVLRAEPAVAGLARGLRTLTTAVLNPSAATGAPRTLADLGVATARDGTLSVDAKRLAAVLAANPKAVETMFASGTGLSAALSTIAKQATDRTFGLDAAKTRYTREVGKIADEQDKLAATTEVTRTRLQRQFAGMDARVASYKSTQAFLTGQIAAWNRSDG